MKTFREYLKEENETDAILQALPDDVYSKISMTFKGNQEEVDSVIQQIANYISMTGVTDPGQMQQMWKNYENIRNTTDAWKVYQQNKQAPMAGGAQQKGITPQQQQKVQEAKAKAQQQLQLLQPYLQEIQKGFAAASDTPVSSKIINSLRKVGIILDPNRYGWVAPGMMQNLGGTPFWYNKVNGTIYYGRGFQYATFLQEVEQAMVYYLTNGRPADRD